MNRRLTSMAITRWCLLHEPGQIHVAGSRAAFGRCANGGAAISAACRNATSRAKQASALSGVNYRAFPARWMPAPGLAPHTTPATGGAIAP